MCKYHINIKVELWKLFIVLLLIIPFSSLNQTSISHISDNNEQFPSNSIIIAENPLISSKIGHFDNEIDRTAVYHNSRDPFYRNPGWGTTEGIERSGAVPVGTDVTIRIRTLASDVEDVKIRYWDGMAESENFITLSVTLTQDGYDYWEGVIPSPTEPDDFYYGFQLTDGTNTDYYHDDNKDGGAGQMYGYRYTDQDWGIVFMIRHFILPIGINQPLDIKFLPIDFLMAILQMILLEMVHLVISLGLNGMTVYMIFLEFMQRKRIGEKHLQVAMTFWR